MGDKVKKFVKSFTIDDKKWGRATERTGVVGKLRDEATGKQCCLGIYLTACGYKNELLNGEGSNPIGANDGLEFWNNAWPKEAEVGSPVDVARELAEVNDAAMKLPARKKKIAELFKKLGVKVRFK